MLLAKLVGLLLLPPGIIIVLALTGLGLRWRWPAVGGALVLAAIALLTALSLPVTARFLMGTLEQGVEPLPESGWTAQAIVVLGGGRLAATPEYQGDSVSAATLERLRYAVRLHRVSGLPILVSGGSVHGEPQAEAELMRQALEQDFKVSPRWVEGQSRNTYENALYSKGMLETDGIRGVLVVTHAWHMPRAAWAFQHVGLRPVPAPTAFASLDKESRLFAYLPRAGSLMESSQALHEWLGLGWYQLRYRSNAEALIPNSPRPSPAPVRPAAGA